ncbi:MAG: hypothetical protein U1B78_02155 [Dehalococcoidia bacterium]|nr:hypothetical protein [Dehalococcoidia bacterium]
MNILRTLRTPLVLAGVLPGLIVLAVFYASLGGFALAQEDGGGTPTPDAQSTPAPDAQETPEAGKDRLGEDFVARLAENLGIGQDQLEEAWRQTQLDLLDDAVAEGRIDEDRAAEIRERIESGEAPFFPIGGHGPHHGRALFGEVAEFLGLDVEDVFQALQDGQSLAQIAQAQGVSAEDLTQFLLDEIQEYVNQMLEDGKIDQARADEILSNAPERVEELINREGLPEKPFGEHGPRGGFPGPNGDLPSPELEPSVSPGLF